VRTFSRTVMVGAEFVGEDLVRFYGILEDILYAMEVRMDVRVSDGVIQDVEGRMKRYTTPVCPRAEEVLKEAVGLSLREEGWISRIYRDMGRRGCQHLAEILIECGRCLDVARMARFLQKTAPSEGSLQDAQERLARWLREHPEARGRCAARR